MTLHSMFDETVRILENRKINAEYFKLTFASKALSQNVLPGQFLNLKITEDTNPLWRRPFSYYRIRGTKVELLYEVMGRGTSLLSKKQPGDVLKALGPLGKSFRLNLRGKKRILVAGGVGVPPLVYLAEYARDSKPLFLLIGCKSKAEAMPPAELKRIRGDIQYATDDGSYGAKGFVTVLLKRILERERPNSIFIQTCGPHPMIQAVLNLARQQGVEGEASIDERMACGVGACLGCMVETKDGWKTSCVEGPVFLFSELAGIG